MADTPDQQDTPKKPSVRERYMARRKELAQMVEEMEKTDPSMAASARQILFPEKKSRAT
jgi:hypothetical protein